MLLVRTDHPQLSQLQTFGQDNGLTIHTDGGRNGRTDLQHALSSQPSRLFLVGTLQDCSAWLRFCVRLPKNEQPQSIVVLGDTPTAETLQRALTSTPSERTMMVWDHNLAVQVELVFELAWGAVVPLMEAAEHVQSPAGLLERARGAIRSLREVSTTWGDDAALWTLEGHAVRNTKGGFWLWNAKRVPAMLQGVLKPQNGVWNAAGQSLQPQEWAPLFAEDEGEALRLRGDGYVWLNGRRERLRAMDVVYLRRVGSLPIAWLADEVSATR